MATKLNGSMYCNVSLAIQLNINHLFTHSWMSGFISNNSLKHLFALNLYDKVDSLNVKQFYLIRERTLSWTIRPSQSRSGNDGNQKVLRTLQNSCITGASPSDCLMSHPGNTLCKGSFPTTDMQTVYSTADWVTLFIIVQ